MANFLEQKTGSSLPGDHGSAGRTLEPTYISFDLVRFPCLQETYSQPTNLNVRGTVGKMSNLLGPQDIQGEVKHGPDGADDGQGPEIGVGSQPVRDEGLNHPRRIFL